VDTREFLRAAPRSAPRAHIEPRPSPIDPPSGRSDTEGTDTRGMRSSIAKSGHAHASRGRSPGTISGAYRNSPLRGRLRHGAHRRARAAGAARPLETAGPGEVIFASERAPGQEEPLDCSWRWGWGCESLDDGKLGPQHASAWTFVLQFK